MRSADWTAVGGLEGVSPSFMAAILWKLRNTGNPALNPGYCKHLSAAVAHCTAACRVARIGHRPKLVPRVNQPFRPLVTGSDPAHSPSTTILSQSLLSTISFMPSKERLQEDPGPQAVAIDDGLEVVPEFRLRAPLDRNSSLSKPEHYLQPPASMREEKIVSQDQRPYGYLQDTQAPEVLEPATYEVNVEEDVVGQVNKRSRKCGMKRSAFVWLIVAVVVIVMIAAILGGVLGSVLRTNNTQQ